MSGQQIGDELLPSSLWNVIVHDRLYLDPAFAEVKLADEQAADLCRMAQRGRKLDSGDHLWLNRYLINEAFTQAARGDLLNSVQATFDAVIVSDAGKQFTVSRRTKSGGLVGTAMRASDILMNRVWELEVDHFRAEPDFLFAPMSLTGKRTGTSLVSPVNGALWCDIQAGFCKHGSNVLHRGQRIARGGRRVATERRYDVRCLLPLGVQCVAR